MTHAADKLHLALHELERALASQEALDPQLRARLERALTDLRAAAEHLPSSADHESLTSQLTSVAQDFEASHPNLSGMVGSVIDALARMGI